MRYIVLVASLAVAGCTDAVMMRHPTTGVVAKCGPYSYTAGQANASAIRESECVNDYKQQGYVRVP